MLSKPFKKKPHKIILLQWMSFPLLSVLFLTAGCEPPALKHCYPGLQRPTSELALIKSTGLRDDLFQKRIYGSFVTAIDGKSSAGFLQNHPESLYVTPGKHVLDIYYNDVVHFAKGELWLVAEPGKTYLLITIKKGYGCIFFFQEEDSGKTVGGIKGSVDEPPDKPIGEIL